MSATDPGMQRIERAWSQMADKQRDALVEIAEIYVELPAQVAKDRKRYEAEAKRRAAKVKREAKEIEPLLKEGEELSTTLWRWLIGQSQDAHDVAYLQDGLSMLLGGLRGYMRFNIPRGKIVSSLRADIVKARELVKRLSGAGEGAL